MIILYFFLELSSYIESTAMLRLEDKLDPHIFQQILEIENAYINYLKVC
jgi:hypothetical protein